MYADDNDQADLAGNDIMIAVVLMNDDDGKKFNKICTFQQKMKNPLNHFPKYLLQKPILR